MFGKLALFIRVGGIWCFEGFIPGDTPDVVVSDLVKKIEAEQGAGTVHLLHFHDTVKSLPNGKTVYTGLDDLVKIRMM